MIFSIRKLAFALILTLFATSGVPQAGEMQFQEFSFGRTLHSGQVLKFNNCFDFNELDGVFVESITLNARGIDKESFLELIIDGYPTGRTFDVRRGDQNVVIDFHGGNQIGVDFREISIVVHGEVYISDITLTLRVVQGGGRGNGGGRDYDRGDNDWGHNPRYPDYDNNTDITVDYLGYYLPGDISVDISKIIAGRNIYLNDYPSKVTFFIESESVSSLSLCHQTDFTHECENKLLKRGRDGRVSFEVMGPYRISDLSVIARGVVKLNKIVFHFKD